MVRFWQSRIGKPKRIYVRVGANEYYIQLEKNDRFSLGPAPEGKDASNLPFETTASVFTRLIGDAISWTEAARILGIDLRNPKITSNPHSNQTSPFKPLPEPATPEPTSEAKRPLASIPQNVLHDDLSIMLAERKKQIGSQREAVCAQNRAYSFLLGLPNTEMNACTSIINRHQNMRGIANATAADLAKLPNVSPAFAQAIAHAFNTDFD